MPHPQPLMTADDFATGMTWEQYLEQVSASARLQMKHYQSVTDDDLSDFAPPDETLYAVILSKEKCGDGAWAVPRLVRILRDRMGIELRIFFRDEREDLMDHLETDGKRAIPKLALLDKDFRIVGVWGPYPEAIKPYVREHAGIYDRSEWYPEVMKYYRKTGHRDLIRDIQTLITELDV